MKIVIDIPKTAYEQIIEAGELDYLEVITAIENGTPLSEVLNGIKSEIENEIDKNLKEPQYQHEDEDWMNGLIMAEDIIDKHISRKENE